tara:strand:- start:3795 stop:4025 length:231 start_codon:yes stop_codon:yes gene_type:complete
MSTKLVDLWFLWLKFTMLIGTVQMIVFLTLVYWLAVPLIGMPLRLFKDPLKSKRSESNWILRPHALIDRELMGNQF